MSLTDRVVSVKTSMHTFMVVSHIQSTGNQITNSSLRYDRLGIGMLRHDEDEM